LFSPNFFAESSLSSICFSLQLSQDNGGFLTSFSFEAFLRIFPGRFLSFRHVLQLCIDPFCPRFQIFFTSSLEPFVELIEFLSWSWSLCICDICEHSPSLPKLVCAATACGLFVGQFTGFFAALFPYLSFSFVLKR